MKMSMRLRVWSRQSKEIEEMHATKCGFEKRSWLKPNATAAFVVCVLLGVGSADACLAGPSSRTAFASPEDASGTLVSAVQEHDERAVTKILGEGSGLVRSEDQTDEALEREHFVQKYQEMHRWVRASEGIATLYVGAENWPFPIPLVSRKGVWRFDSKAGSDEILFRRIGENEVTAIVACNTLAAQRAHPGTDSEADRLVKMLLPQASKPKPFRGYYFHILPNSGSGIAAIAYPATYRSSGVMTFIATQDGGVFEKDLGASTAKIAQAMTTYQSDGTWTPAEQAPQR
jgi:Protein of unknown function (DUF2950)